MTESHQAADSNRGRWARAVASTSAWWRRRSKWFHRGVWTLLIAALLQPIVGFFGVPLLIRKVIVPQIEKRLNATVRLDDAQFNPYTWRLGLDRLSVADPDGHDAVGFTRAEIDFNPLSSLFLPGWRFNDIILNAPYVGATYGAELGLNLARIVAGRDPAKVPEPNAAPTRVRRFIVGSIEIIDGRGELDDRTFARPIALHVGGLAFRVENLDTTPKKENLLALVATTDSGARVEWQGTLSLDPPTSVGSIVVTSLSLPESAAHATRLTDLDLKSGRLSAVLTYHLAPLENPPIVRANLAQASLTAVTADRDGAALASFPAIEIRGATIDAVARQVIVPQLTIAEGSLLVERDQTGTLNLARMIKPRPVTASSASMPPVAAVDRQPRVDVTTLSDPAQQLLTTVSYILEDIAGAWSIALEDVEITKQSLDLVDRSPPEVVRSEFRDLSLRAGPIRTADGFVVPFELAAALNGAPTTAEGSFSVIDRTLDAVVATEQLALQPFGPYVRLITQEPFASTRIAGGRVTASGHVHLATPDPTRIDAQWSGSVGLVSLRAVRIDSEAVVVAAQAIALKGDATFMVGTREGIAVDWLGAVKATTCEGGPSLIEAVGLGAGRAQLGSFDIDGKLSFARPPAGDGRGTWAGSVALTGLEANELAIGERLAARVGSGSLVADAEVTIVAAGGLKAGWKGDLSATDLVADATGATPAKAGIGQVAIKGRGEVGVAADGALSVAWEGETSVAKFAADLPNTELVARASTAALNGRATVRQSRDRPLEIEWKGRASLGDSEATQGAPEAGLRVAEQRATLDGSISAHVTQDGGASFALDAALDIERPSIVTPGERAMIADTATLALKGTAEGSVNGNTRRIAWNATTTLGEFRAGLGRELLDGAATEPSARGATAVITGNGALSVDDAERQLDWTGTVTLGAGGANAPKMASGLDVLFTQLAADGSLVLRSSGDLTSVSWKGTQSGKELHASAVDLGGKADVKAASFGGTSDLTAQATGERIEARWRGDIAVESTSAQLSDKHAAATTLSFDGEANLLRVGAGGAGLSLNGKATGTGVSATSGSGAEALTGSGETLRFTGSLELNPGASGSALVAKGDIALDVAHASRGEPVLNEANVRSIALTGVAYDQATRTLSADRLAIAGGVIDGEIASPASKEEPARDNETSAAPSAEPVSDSAGDGLASWNIRLREFHLEESAINMHRGTGETRETVSVDQVLLDAENLSTDGNTLGTVNMTARLAGSGKVAIVGTVDPFHRPIVADLKLTVVEALLPPTNPYAENYVGWRIAAGRLNTEIPVVVQDGKVKGSVQFLLDSVELGERSKDPNAPSLPLDFALAIMKDSKGQVKGTIPFSGDATNPKFTLTGLIVEVILGFIGKIATAPFQLIASAIEGAGDTDLSALSFDPGSDVLTSDGVKAIDLLTKALNERPGLKVTARGQFARDLDGRALRLATLRGQVAERARNGFPSRKTVDDALYRKLVTEMWRETPAGLAVKNAKTQPPFETIELAALEGIPLTDAMLRVLAQRRADAVVAAFAGAGVPPDRVSPGLAADDAIEQPKPQAAIELGLASAAAQ